MYTYELFDTVPGKKGYRILVDGNPIVQQEITPGADGYQFMTAEEATAQAQLVLERIGG